MRHFFGTRDYLEKVSNAVRGKLIDRTSGSGDRDWVMKGTEPELENFFKFNFSASGFLFTFDEYSIASYAAGREEVWVPFSELSGLVLPDELKERT